MGTGVNVGFPGSEGVGNGVADARGEGDALGLGVGVLCAMGAPFVGAATAMDTMPTSTASAGKVHLLYTICDAVPTAAAP